MSTRCDPGQVSGTPCWSVWYSCCDTQMERQNNYVIKNHPIIFCQIFQISFFGLFLRYMIQCIIISYHSLVFQYERQFCSVKTYVHIHNDRTLIFVIVVKVRSCSAVWKENLRCLRNTPSIKLANQSWLFYFPGKNYDPRYLHWSGCGAYCTSSMSGTAQRRWVCQELYSPIQNCTDKRQWSKASRSLQKTSGTYIWSM